MSVINWIKNNRTITVFTTVWVLPGIVLLAGYSISNWQGWDWKTLDWQALTGFATWILGGGIGIAIWQIREARRSTQAQISMDLFRELRSDRALEILRFIYKLNPEEDLQKLSTIDKHSIEHILDRLDILGILVDEGIINERLAIDGYAGVTALRVWYILRQYIWKVRCERKYFGDNFEDFTRRCMEYFHDRDIEVNFYGEKTNSKMPLVTLFRLDTSLRPRNLKKIKHQRKRNCQGERQERD